MLQRLLGRHDEVVAVDRGTSTPSRSKPISVERRCCDAGVGDAQLGARDGRESDERPDLDVVGTDAVGAAAAAWRPPCTVSVFVPMPSIVAPSATRNPAEILHVRLAGGVAEHGGARRRRPPPSARSRCRHARLVEEDVGARAASSARKVIRSRRARGRRPAAASARKCVSSRRRPITSPPGGASVTSPQRARAAARRAGSRRGSACRARDRARAAAPPWRGSRATSAPVQSRSRPTLRISCTSVSMSRMRGTFSSGTGCSVSSAAPTIGQRGVLVAGRADGAAAGDDHLRR